MIAYLQKIESAGCELCIVSRVPEKDLHQESVSIVRIRDCIRVPVCDCCDIPRHRHLQFGGYKRDDDVILPFSAKPETLTRNVSRVLHMHAFVINGTSGPRFQDTWKLGIPDRTVKQQKDTI